MNTPVTNPPAAPVVAAPPRGKRRFLLLVTTGVLILLLIAYGIWWLIFASHFESTDDAYVAGNVVQVTPQIGGTVVAINADDTQRVEAGSALVLLDPSDANVALDQATAQLAQAVREVRTLFVNNGALNANITSRNSELERARTDLARRQELIASGAVSKEELAHARTALQSAESAAVAAREQLASNRVLTDHTSVAQHPTVLRAAAQVQSAYLAVARTSLPAPITGYIAKRSVQVGQRVAAGMPLLSIVPLDSLWIDANFKEVQIARMRIGQPVTLHSDVYGSKFNYHGKVVGLSAGTGSAFALLPAQNASGNWIKIVQRIPVRISLDPAELAERPLRLGLSMQVEVDIADHAGTSLTSAAATRTEPVYQTAAFDKAGSDGHLLISRIIAENSADKVADKAADKRAPEKVLPASR
ncbi:HlyD family efflux transporter periplasmic adaptor subunit [Actimicrobium sp. CCI2.3]|uniref:HlyD family efflux transporter periplasmic adaptor subunit n=1 Tax=Actimicrobium sp. CCI2.3 TaxID=3048616 RepID=UPI002AB39451|nr:HlyD family efflux transporter periplasmic adaptor subunit [Actimicrobium sp. CCI2.3]MDY7575541.1 HlyD family efflux transporter periplasmic adaptor subunit [Actimicrobium sp. CCI2.3]MEB0022804.1 HlyD family efflux transporter periplasmic adaptor subunit [Actimicrobium sp. CCI2.3]